MRLCASRFVHSIPVGANGFLLLHAVSQMRLKIDAEVDTLLRFFATPNDWPECYGDLCKHVHYDRATLTACIDTLIERGFLTDQSPEDEQAATSLALSETYGRDPAALLDQYRKHHAEGGKEYWATGSAQKITDLSGTAKRLDVIMLGDCDLHMETDFLRQEAARRGYDLRIAASAADDFALVEQHKHDIIIIGALYARHFLTLPLMTDQPAHAATIVQAQHILTHLRRITTAPIVIDALPEPTVEPLGLAEPGLDGHRNRFRRANLALVEMAATFVDVFVTDVAAVLGAAGSTHLVDDGQVGFTHMGSPGWMLQRPAREKKAVHDQMPDMQPLAKSVGGDPYGREKIMAHAHMDQIIAVLGLNRIKCVIVDLDNTLWPGVLAETGAPFAWDPSISGAFSFIGLYFGLHEALLCLKKRGIVLACVSKNDEKVVRDLWHYPDTYPRDRLLTLDDFVTTRINWHDKAENIRSIAAELGFAPETFLFIDDNPVERDRVHQFLPELTIWGEDLFRLRRDLLTDPRLQVTKITTESASRTQMVKAQLDRQKFRTAAGDENAYIASLEIKIQIERITTPEKLDRIDELFRRTTQFNATGLALSVADLHKHIANPDTRLYALHVADRFGDHGLVGAALVEGGAITGLVISCRVLSMGVEPKFIRFILDDLAPTYPQITARIIETSRNLPVRSIYRDTGFSLGDDNVWRYTAGKS